MRASAIPGAQFDDLVVAEELGRCRWSRRRRWIRTVGRARPRGLRVRQAGVRGQAFGQLIQRPRLVRAPQVARFSQGSSVPVAEPGVMMALGDQYLAMQGSAWR
jgi:hypothetical protein